MTGIGKQVRLPKQDQNLNLEFQAEGAAEWRQEFR